MQLRSYFYKFYQSYLSVNKLCVTRNKIMAKPPRYATMKMCNNIMRVEVQIIDLCKLFDYFDVEITVYRVDLRTVEWKIT